jgi:pyruvate dehydrogenase E1 component alpha subunit
MLLNPSKARTLEEQILFIRLVEDRLQELCLEGLAGDLHFSKGEEAISVGVGAALRPTDYVVTHHRTIANAITKGVPLQPLLAEILGKAGGINGGMAGEMHISYPAKRFMFTFQLVGTCVPVAAGIAWAVKNVKKTDDVVVVFHGDAATANGQWHEGVNIAAAQGLPLLLVCENNELAGNVRPEHYMPPNRWPLVAAHGSVGERANGYGIGVGYVNGNDVEKAKHAAQEAIDYVRRESSPFLLDCFTTRLGRHKQGMGDLRSKEEMGALLLRDPLRCGKFSEETVSSMKAEINQCIEEIQATPGPQQLNSGIVR